jgi:hypothetical protein
MRLKLSLHARQGQKILTADHLGYSLKAVVHHRRKHVGHDTVGA